MRRDQEIFDLIENEHQRQLKGMELIASENFVSDEVMAAMGSYLTNKYAEGLPGKRYYGGCQVVDQVEDLARERVKKVFGAEFANVQPHSGAQANAGTWGLRAPASLPLPSASGKAAPCRPEPPRTAPGQPGRGLQVQVEGHCLQS